MRSLSYAEALDVVTAVRAAAAEESLTGAVAVVDAAGNDLAVAREATASSFAAAVARAKARTAAHFARPSVELADLAQRYPDVLAVAADDAGFRPVVLDGGVPLFQDGVLVGAVGVSGGLPDVDRRCADRGAAAVASTEESR
jgi:uncharacterized protein GlcG (DUF336 family)